MGEVIQLFPNNSKEANRMSENRSTLNFKRVDGGQIEKDSTFIRVMTGTAVVAKKTFNIIWDVADIYAQLFHGLLTLGIKVGLFILLLPTVSKFVLDVLHLLQQ